MPLKIYSDNSDAAWVPSEERITQSNMFRFSEEMEKSWGRELSDYDSLHKWSVEKYGEFWDGLWDFCGVVAEAKGKVVLEQGSTIESVSWFPEASLNFAENLLRYRGNEDAVVFWGETKVKQRFSRDELYQAVAQVAAALRARGVKAGDRVAAFMPNSPDTLIAMLAATSIGAVFSSASPDFGPQGIIDRFGQIEPVVLIATDSYVYNGKTHDCLEKVETIIKQIPSVHTVVICPYIKLEKPINQIRGAITMSDLVEPYAHVNTIEFEQLSFNHPLYVVFSSGTTGVPKCIVHRAGGALLLHLKEHQLHGNIKDGSRLFYFATCSWVMWNWLVSGLASGAALMLYDGSPFADDENILFDYMQTERFTHFGTSAKFIEACAKSGLKPNQSHDTSNLEVLYSTGSPLMAEGYDYIYENFKQDIHVASISGGTDLLGAFVGGNPVTPVWRGEIQCKQLGMAVEVFDQDGGSILESKGELVCTAPFPTQPLYFWNDSDGKKYHEAYFSRFEGIWCHGDFCEVTKNGGFIIYGRSDTTLNPGGVRIGTSEIYRQVELIEEVTDSAVIGQRWPLVNPTDVRVVLFVQLRSDVTLNDELIDRIKKQIRTNTTPRHVPARVVQVEDIPRTKSGKIVEIAIRQVVHNEPVANTSALGNPDALLLFKDRDELQT